VSSKSRRFVPSVGLFAALAFSATAPTASAQAKLRWSFKTGDSARYEFQQKNDVRLKVPGRDQEIVNLSELNILQKWTVKDVASDGTAQISLVFERVRTAINAGDQKIEFDTKNDKASDEPAHKALSSVYGAAVGPDSVYSLKVNARGEVLEAKIPDKVSQAIQGSPFQAMADGGSIFSEVGLKNLFLQVFPVLPDEPKDKGATWTRTATLPAGPLVMTLTDNDKLEDLSDSAARVTTKIDTQIKPLEGSPFTVTVNKQSGSGDYSLDLKAGRVKESNIKQEFALELKGGSGAIQEMIKLDANLKLVP
jgi:hypothetical protein